MDPFALLTGAKTHSPIGFPVDHADLGMPIEPLFREGYADPALNTNRSVLRPVVFNLMLVRSANLIVD